MVTAFGSTCLTSATVEKPVPAPTSRVDRRLSSSRASREGRAAQLRGPEQRIRPAVVNRRAEPVEPVRLLLMLDQAHAMTSSPPQPLATASRHPHESSPRIHSGRRRALAGSLRLRLCGHASLGDNWFGGEFRERQLVLRGAPSDPFAVLEEDTNLLISGLCGRISKDNSDYPRLPGPPAFAIGTSPAPCRVAFALDGALLRIPGGVDSRTPRKPVDRAAARSRCVEGRQPVRSLGGYRGRSSRR